MRERPKRAERSPHFIDTETARRRRWHAGIMQIHPPECGTLWWVDESLWQDCLGGYDRKSTRKGHPGLSAMRQPVTDIYGQAPMFHGTSGRSGPVVVTGLSPDNPPGLRTAFGHLLAPVPLKEWTSLDGLRRVRANRHKPRLGRHEQARFNAFLDRRMPT